MRLIPAVGLLAASVFAGPAIAQGPDTGTVECRSRDFQTTECQTGWRRAELVQQLSRAPCVEGRSWGARRGTVWVSEGCAGLFAQADRPGGGGPGWAGGVGPEFECRSEDRRFTRCGGNRVPAQLLRQLSRTACTEGQTWGVDREGLWVDQGCAGLFRQGGAGPGGGPGGGAGGEVYQPPADAEFVTCQSQRGRPETCGFRVPARHVGLLQQLSETPCAEGGNWTWDQHSVRVWDGCGAMFRFFPR